MVDLSEGGAQRQLKKERPEGYPNGPYAWQTQRPAPSSTRESTPYPNDERAQKPLKKELAEVYVDAAVQTETLVPSPTRCSTQNWHRKDIRSIPPWLLFFGFTCILLGFVLQGFRQSTPLGYAVGDEDVPVAEEEVPEVTIAVMGPTGSGKSTFINLISGSDFGIGDGLRSFTDRAQATNAFRLDGRRVVLIDTPGFDDTSLSDTEVLNMTATFLADSYEQGKTLAGVLYFHRISDRKMTGISRRNFGMFRKLCGDNVLKNVVIVTNMWEEVDPDVGNKREAELKTEDDFFKPVLDKRARMARHDNTVSSAETIIRLILGNHPLPLRIQEELVKEHKIISETSAGEELNQLLNAQIKKHEEGMRKLKEEMEQAMRDKDEEVRRELEEEMKGLVGKVEKLRNDREKLVSDYKRRIATLKGTIRASEKERAEMREEINKLKEDTPWPWSFLKDLYPG